MSSFLSYGVNVIGPYVVFLWRQNDVNVVWGVRFLVVIFQLRIIVALLQLYACHISVKRNPQLLSSGNPRRLRHAHSVMSSHFTHLRDLRFIHRWSKENIPVVLRALRGTVSKPNGLWNRTASMKTLVQLDMYSPTVLSIVLVLQY